MWYLIASLLFVLIQIQVSGGSSDTRLLIHSLNNSRLCNNGNYPIGYNETKCRVHKVNAHPKDALRKDYEYCDKRNIANDKCKAAAIKLATFSTEELLSVIPMIDADNSIRRIEVRISSEEIDIDVVGREIDKFLTPRPWWYVTKEPYSWNKHTHRVIVLDRMKHGYESRLRVLAALNFPVSKRICAESPMVVNRKDFYHPGWASILGAYGIAHKELPFAITAMYVSLQNNVNDSTAFISGSDCPTVKNKWACAFLETTSCPVPNIISTCTTPKCVQNIVGDTLWSSAVFNASAQVATKVIRGGTLGKPYREAKEKAQKLPSGNGHLSSEVALSHRTPNTKMQYIDPYNTTLAPFQNIFLNPDGDFFIRSYILRYNYFYRSQMAHSIKELQTTQNFSSSDRCVAAQIRRGDRTARVNITDYCMHAERPIPDYGCQSVPYSLVTLHHVIESASKIAHPDVKVLVVSTDDEKWLNEQKIIAKEMHPDWRVVNLVAPKNPPGTKGDSYSFMRYQAHTASGVLLHGSIQLSRQCEGFVGHFGCGGTSLFYKAMCAQHGSHEYVCPPAFDVRTIKELQMPYRKPSPPPPPAKKQKTKQNSKLNNNNNNNNNNNSSSSSNNSNNQVTALSKFVVAASK